MVTRISLKKVIDDAENFFRGGGFYCSEAVVASIRKNVAPEMPEALIAAASGFPGGVGGSLCVCGAVSGGVISLGGIFGRTAPSSADDPKSVNSMKLAFELQDSFRKNHKGALCCKVHTKDLKLGTPEQKAQCVAFTGEVAAKTAEIIAREHKISLE